MVASKCDTCNPWVKWGTWIDGVQRESQRVTIVHDWAHDELRTGLIVGAPMDKGGADAVFAHRANLRI